MNTLSKLSVYGAALALLSLGAYATGSAVGPLRSPAPAREITSGAEGAGHGDAHSSAVTGTADQPAGPASSRGGYTLAPTASTPTAGTTTELTFHIIGPDGAPVTAFDEEHTKRLHLIVVRRDTTGFQHLHPTMDPDGTWRTSLRLPTGGVHRVFADFTPTGGPATTLGVDLSVAGTYEPVTPAPSRIARIDDYEVRLDGELSPGRSSPVTLTVTRDGAPVTDLQPYLGAYGHLVALRSTDLAYLHVHPDRSPDDGRTAAGPQIRFLAEVPSTGTYRLFLDFQHASVVRTAEFTLPAGPTPEPGALPTAPAAGTPEDDHGHPATGDRAGGEH
ncbi:hypothetical protein [Pseudonocardia xishanensis]|uniref:hypothetical protein n=1 Tax=Pseudonocardia xishanensis TaxID=630995 RepID=UPI0031EADA40